jgi:hypothetical protein
MEVGRKITTKAGALWREADGALVEWEAGEVRVTRPWPLPRSWLKLGPTHSRWREVNGRVGSWAWAPDAERRVRSWAGKARLAAWSTVPLGVRLAWAAARLAGEAWPLLSMLARCPGARELALSVPMLAGALTAHGELRTPVARPLRSIRALLALPDGMARWRRVARWLGFDDSRAFVNLVRRLSLEGGFGSGAQRRLREVWADSMGRKRLLHAPRVDAGVVELLASAVRRGLAAQVHPELVDVAFGADVWGGVAQNFDEAAMHWQHAHPTRPLPSWRTAADVEAALAPRAHFLPEVTWSGVTPPPFPPPPLPAGPGITPLASPEALAVEGEEMEHCLGWLAWEYEARARLGYGYRVEFGGERASLWLQREEGEPTGFRVRQLRGPRNAAPSPDLVREVASWLVGNAAPPGQPRRWLVGAWAAPMEPLTLFGPLGSAWGGGLYGDLRLADDDIPF